MGCGTAQMIALEGARTKAKETIGDVAQKRHQANRAVVLDTQQLAIHTKCNTIRGDTLRATYGQTKEGILDWWAKCGGGVDIHQKLAP